MFAIQTVTIVIYLTIFSSTCYGQDLYPEAILRTEKQNEINEKLYKKYNVSESSYESIFASEFIGPSTSNKKADILFQYKNLVKENLNKCKRPTFKDCLYEGIEKIPSADRCELPRSKCDPKDKYSQVSGVCNNLKKQYTGAANSPYNRMLDAVFADEISKFRRTKNNEEMPNPRSLGNILDQASDFKNATIDNELWINNFVGLMFSQMIAHDTTSRKVIAMRGKDSNGISCCKSTYSGPLRQSQIHPGCVPVPLPKDDPFYADKGIYCQSYVRMQSTLNENCDISYQPENLVSSFLDLNTIYSNSDKELKKLLADTEDSSKGTFKMDPLNILPFNENGELIAGDFRVGQTPLLGLIHSLFYRLHNIIAINLGELNPKWNNKKIFREARRITIACYQRIIYYDWLPKVLGSRYCRRYKLNCKGKCYKYDEDINPTTTIEFAMNAFRFFHVNLPSTVEMVNKNGRIVEEILLSNTYGQLDMLKTKYNNILRGLMQQKQRMNRAAYTEEVRNLFLKTKYMGKDVGVDGFILDVMRSRDTGTAPFIDYYQMCTNSVVKNWKDLKSHFETDHFELMQQLYKDVSDIELMVGILLEKRRGNFIGKIGGCLVAEQFYRYRYGDRFFYAHPNNPYPFSSSQLDAINRMSFTRLVCMTTDIERVPKRGFIAISEMMPYINCSRIDPLNLSPFKEWGKTSTKKIEKRQKKQEKRERRNKNRQNNSNALVIRQM